jgi:hypothetical protein
MTEVEAAGEGAVVMPKSVSDFLVQNNNPPKLFQRAESPPAGQPPLAGTRVGTKSVADENLSIELDIGLGCTPQA